MPLDAGGVTGSDAASGSAHDAGAGSDASGPGSGDAGSGADAGIAPDAGSAADAGIPPCNGSGSGDGGLGSGGGSGGGSGSDVCTTCSDCGSVIYGDQYSRIGDPVSVPHGVIADMQPPLTFTASGLPPGLTIDRDSGAIRGVVTPDALTASPYVVVVEARDSTQPRAWITQVTFNWWVSVHVDPSLAQDTITGDPAYLRLPTPAGCGLTPPIEYIVTGLPDGLTASRTGEITGTVTAAPDTYTVHVELIDGSLPPRAIAYEFAWVVSPRPT